MNSTISIAARAAALRFDPTVLQGVELVLAQGADGPVVAFSRLGDSLALASLIVAAAQFGWQIHQDLGKAGGTPGVEDVAIRVIDRLERDGRLPPALPAQDRDAAIRRTVEELIAQTKKDLP
ncbi:hypothetical protein D3877_18490 [Azospirillum cavernae]|uniref:Uncharacterized protein n=1 Tax=Azospirillum cavernae TaxID=2320860 RepID=A0A418VY85_9PROT|nr:hypothetical protein [Azospirillum cavernae]RJF82060.1 hypothetical protein D3877_18490 [Azospirillum cavernae]